jgi:microsomal dipeptidase-like Zn-dependent dipeptidase
MRWILGLLLVLVALAGATLLVGPGIAEDRMNPVEPHAAYVVSDKAKALHKTLDMADLHADTLLWGRNILVRGTRGHVDIPRLIEGRFAVQVFSTVTKSPKGQNYNQNSSDTDQITTLAMLNAWPRATWNSLLERALYQGANLARFADASGGALVQLKSKADLQKVLDLRAKGGNVVGGLLATEGAHPLEGKIENVKRLYDAGFRMIGLQHFFDNELGGSLHGLSKAGLTPFGYQAVKAIEGQGMIIDVAHSSEQVVSDVLQIASKPIVVSHSGVHGVCPSPRNISDKLMVEIAAKGGLIGIGYWDGAVCDYTPDGVAKAIKYAVNLVGVDHVALGSDYDGTTSVKFDASESVALIDALQRQGLSDDDIRKVAGGNTIRFLQERLPD